MTTEVNTLSTNLAITTNWKVVYLKIKQDLIENLLKEIKDKHISNNTKRKLFIVIIKIPLGQRKKMKIMS